MRANANDKKRSRTSRFCVLIDPTVEEYVPAAQGLSLHMPEKGHSVPEGHRSQDFDAELLAYCPITHDVQVIDPRTDVKEPHGHGVSRLEADEFVS